MTDEIKRPNYFTSQFLVESDFNTEQSYQVQARRRHNRVSHTFGVADSPGGNSLSVTFSTNTPFPTVIVGVGTAIDKDGNEIVFTNPVTYQLKTHPNSGNVLLFVSYQDVPTDPYTPAPENFTRTTERPSIQDVNATNPPATDGSVILLARISLNVNAQIQSQASIDTTVRTYSSAKLGPGVVTGIAAGTSTSTGNIAVGTITGGTNGAANAASSTTATGNLAIGTIQGGWVGTNANIGNIANGTITGNNTPTTTAGSGNIALGTITGGNNASGVATGNIAIGTITGGTSATSGASSGTAAGNLAIGTIRGGQVGTTPAGSIVGNIAFGSITGGTNGTANAASSTTATGNLAIGTIQGGWVGANANIGNIANGTITGNQAPNSTAGSGNIAVGTITGGTNGTANAASSTTATGNLAIGTIQGGWVGANANIGNISNGTITGNNTPTTTAGSGNIALGTITGGNNTSGVATGNIAIGTITGGTTATSGASNGTAAGNLAIGTIRGGQVGTTPAGIVGNIAFGTITGGTDGTNATGNIAINTIVGGTNGNIVASSITKNELASASVDATKFVNVLAVADAAGTGVINSAGNQFIVTFNFNDAHPGKHYHLIFSVRASQIPTGTPPTPAVDLVWFEMASYTGAAGTPASSHNRSVIVQTRDKVAVPAGITVNFDWKAILLAM